MKILPAALYGCQVAPVATGALKALRSGVADAVLRGGAANRSCDLVLATATALECDPLCAILVMHVQAFRRHWHLEQGARQSIRE
eukprot:15071400-Alexandrium_andersonii.AAC.1